MIAGLDASTTRTGWAGAAGEFRSITAKTGPEDPNRRLYELETGLVRAIRLRPPCPVLVVIEGYNMHGPGAQSKIRLGELGGVFRCRLHELGATTVEVSPRSLKLWATGNGAAKKPEMIRAAVLLEGLTSEPNDDEADALLLRAMGRAAYRLDGFHGIHDREAEALAGVQWPTIQAGQLLLDPHQAGQ